MEFQRGSMDVYCHVYGSSTDVPMTPPFRWLCLVLLLGASCKKQEIELVNMAPPDSRYGKWEPAALKHGHFQINRRTADDSSFEPMIECRHDGTHCEYKISADEMAKEWNKAFNQIAQK